MSSITDNFAGAGPVASPPWVSLLGGLWTQSGGVARAVSGGENAMAYTGATWDADHAAEVILGPMEPGTYVGVCVRAGSGQYVGFYADGSAPADRYLFNEAGVLANTVQFTASAGGVLRLAATGATITASYNGLEIGQITTALTGGAPGLAAFDPGGSAVASWTGDGAQTAPPTEHVVRLLARRGPAQVTAGATEQAPVPVAALATRQPMRAIGAIAQQAPSPVTARVTRQPVLVRAGVLAQAAEMVQLLARRGATRLAAAISSGAHAVRLIARRGPIRIATPTPPAPSGATAMAVHARRGAVRTSASLAAVVASGVRLLVRRGPVRVRALVAQAAAALGRLRAVLAADTTRATLTGAPVQATLASDTTRAVLATDGTRAVLMSDRIRATIEVEA